MIEAVDKKVFHSMSFNEQMSWIAETVAHIIRYNAEFDIIKKIREKGRVAYGELGYTHAINRLFSIIKVDPKNKAVLSEVCRAEQELIAFIYGESDALSERQIYAYWDTYLQSYMAELEAHPMHYVLIKGTIYMKRIL